MICIAISQSNFCVATMVLYTCIWVPIQQLKNALVSLFRFVVLFAYHQPIVEVSNASPEPCLPVCRLEDLRKGHGRQVDETCSICLMEFEGEDLVSQLSKCGHVFHVKCIEKWLDCNNFNCPLCRSSFLRNVNHNSHPKHVNVDDLNPYTSSYLGYSWH